MKKLFFTIVLLSVFFSSMSQFTPQPLNYPGSGYWPVHISITDPQHVWIGSIQEFGEPCSFSAKTADGGESWVLDSIPVPGSPSCTSVCGVDSNTCFYVFTDHETAGGSIWKTTDGGYNWTGLTTNEFVGGFADFYHAFTADTGVAMGDPVDGYFEILLTYDGGANWTRLPSEYIPAPLDGEYSYGNVYSAVGDIIWFATNMGRCYKSADRGLNWSVTQVTQSSGGEFDVCFSSEQKGCFIGLGNTNDIAITYDGGASWDTVAIPPGYMILDVSGVGGFDGGFVFTGWKNYLDVFFTPDMFTNSIQIGASLMSTGSVSFYDASTGWLAGGESGYYEIFKYNDVLTSANTAIKEKERMSVFPNPADNYSLVKFPAGLESKSLVLRISDMTGNVIDQFQVKSADWTTLNASLYKDGVYLITVFEENILVGQSRWVVSHR